MKIRMSAVLALLLAVTLGACGKASLSTTFGDGDGDDLWRPSAGTQGPGQGPGQTGGPIGGTETPGSYSCVLIPAVGGQRTVGLGQSADLAVYVYSLETGDILSDIEVRYEVDEPASVDVVLSARRSFSDDTGRANVRIASNEAGAFRVEAKSICSRPLVIEGEILELPTGDLSLGFRYPQRDLYDIAPVEVRLFTREVYRCSQRGNPRAVSGYLAEGEAPNVDGRVEFNDLLVDENYTAVAFGLGQYGEIAALGCLDNILLTEDTTTESDIDLLLQPLDPGGTYDVTSHWDFSAALNEFGPVGSILLEIIAIAQNPGQGLYDFLMNRIRDFVGGVIGSLLDTFLQITGLANLIQNAINDLVNGSETLSRLRDALQDVVQVVNKLEVLSRLDIGKTFGDYEVYGVDQWQGIAIYWRWNCPRPIPPECGRLPLRFDQMDLGVLVGEWTGRVVGYDQLQIDRHPIDLRYGELILWVIEGVLFPALLDGCDPFDGPCDRIRLEDAIARVVGCSALANFITGGSNCLRVFGIDVICRDTIESVCTGFINIAFGGILRNLIQSLRFDSVIDMSGRVTLVNLSEDLGVDELHDGIYNGSLFLGSTPAPFTAPFCGIHRNWAALGNDPPSCRPD